MEKKYIKYLIISLVILIILTGALNFTVDPLLYYQRDKRPLPVLYTEDQRYLIPGLIKNFRNHNAAIIGTSMAGIFRASEVGALLNDKTIKLTVNGATLFEQYYILSQYLDTHPNANNIIWVVDPMYIDVNPELFTIRTYNYPFFLYDTNKLNLKYLINYSVTTHSIQTIASSLLGVKFYMKTKNLDEIHTWPLDTPKGCKQIIQNYNKMASQHFEVLDPILVPLSNFNKLNATANLNRIVGLAQIRKDVQFHLILPPYSIVRYLFEKENKGLDRILEARNTLAAATNGYENIKIIDMQALEDIITNLDLYIDMIHYSSTINTSIINKVIDHKFDKYETVLENTEKLRLLADRYDFNKIKKCGF